MDLSSVVNKSSWRQKVGRHFTNISLIFRHENMKTFKKTKLKLCRSVFWIIPWKKNPKSIMYFSRKVIFFEILPILEPRSKQTKKSDFSYFFNIKNNCWKCIYCNFSSKLTSRSRISNPWATRITILKSLVPIHTYYCNFVLMRARRRFLCIFPHFLFSRIAILSSF